MIGNPTEDINDLDSQNYSGLAYGIRTHQSIVFLQTDNWRISVEFSENDVSVVRLLDVLLI